MNNLGLSSNLHNQLYTGIGMLVISIILVVLFKDNRKLEGLAAFGFLFFFVSLFQLYKSIGLLYYSEQVIGQTIGVMARGYRLHQ